MIKELQENFKLSTDVAEKKYEKWLNDIGVEQGVFEHKKIQNKDNPGIPILLQKVLYKKELLIKIDNITNIRYIEVLENYLKAILCLTQNIKSDKEVSEEYVNEICKTEKIIELEVKEITPPKSSEHIDIYEGELEFGSTS